MQGLKARMACQQLRKHALLPQTLNSHRRCPGSCTHRLHGGLTGAALAVVALNATGATLLIGYRLLRDHVLLRVSVTRVSDENKLSV